MFKNFTQSTYYYFLSIIVVVLATDFAPPFIRILGHLTWTTLGITEGQWSVLMALRGLLFIFFILAAGVLGDLTGRRRMLKISLVAFTLCLPLLMVTEERSVPFWVAFGLMSVFAIMVRTLAVTFLVLKFRGRERIIALVLFSVASGAGFLLSPLITRWLNEHVGYNTIFIIPLALAIAGYVLVNRYLQESQESFDLWRMDVVALAVWTFGLCLMIFAGVLSGGVGWTNPLVVWGLVIGLALMLLVNWLSGQPLPGRWRFNLQYDRKLGVAIFAGVVLNLAFYAIATQVFNFMSRVQNYSSLISGVALAPILIGALASTRVIRMIKGFKISEVIAVGLVVIALPALILFLVRPDLSYWVLLPSLVLLGFGFILGNSPRLLLLSSSVPGNLAATVQAIGSSTSHMGSALAYSFMMTLLEGFGMAAHQQTLEGLGLSEVQIAIRLSTLARASEEISILAPTEEQAALMQQIDFLIVQSYTTGLSRAMLVLGGVCLFSAAIVYLGLRRSNTGEMEQEE